MLRDDGGETAEMSYGLQSVAVIPLQHERSQRALVLLWLLQQLRTSIRIETGWQNASQTLDSDKLLTARLVCVVLGRVTENKKQRSKV